MSDNITTKRYWAFWYRFRSVLQPETNVSRSRRSLALKSHMRWDAVTVVASFALLKSAKWPWLWNSCWPQDELQTPLPSLTHFSTFVFLLQLTFMNHFPWIPCFAHPTYKKKTYLMKVWWPKQLTFILNPVRRITWTPTVWKTFILGLYRGLLNIRQRCGINILRIPFALYWKYRTEKASADPESDMNNHLCLNSFTAQFSYVSSVNCPGRLMLLCLNTLFSDSVF